MNSRDTKAKFNRLSMYSEVSSLFLANSLYINGEIDNQEMHI